MTIAAWELVLEAAKSLTARGLVKFTRAQLLDEVRRRDASRRPESLGPVIQGMAANAPGGLTSPCGTPLVRVGRGVYRLAEQSPATTTTGPPSRPALPMPRTAPAAEVVASDRRVDIVLVGCVKTKADEPRPARLLYKSPLFQKRRRYAETRGHRWYVLSAEHGLVHPDALLEPYDVALAKQPDDYRHAWAHWVAAKLRLAEGNLRGRRIEIHAGQAYAAPLLPLLRADGAQVTQPLAGLTHGQHLAWYNQQSDEPAPDPAPPATLPDGADEPAESWLSNIVLLDGPHVRPGFTYRWPDQTETYTSVTELTIASAGTTHQVRIAVCDREAYGSLRRRIVVFVGSAPVAEAVGVDDHHHSEALAGLLKDADNRMIRPGEPVPEVYAGFPLVSFPDEVSGPYTRGGLAVRLRENDVISWAAFALARTAVRTGAPPAGPAPAGG
jgi:hypothetical protein